MTGSTKTGRAQAAREQSALPKSMGALRQVCVSAIKLYRVRESECWADQHAKGDQDDDLFMALDRGGEVLTYAGYRQALAQREKALKDSVPPAVWRAAMRRAEEDLDAE